eukprot:TRINITY_DN7604_c0_g1_i2.p2 TRINITY_DN7604_c0_g1~~TRINITY_DN7604_c0_g1_i2.p2  ORF type:complete len:193 (+),score=27.31 TRINITY_DN7604_c0_g1_i2:863-1441(+)
MCCWILCFAYFRVQRYCGQLKCGDDRYEIWTREYITELAAYLRKRIAEIVQRKRAAKPSLKEVDVTIVETCAGDGHLMHFLHEALSAAEPLANVRLFTNDVAEHKTRKPKDGQRKVKLVLEAAARFLPNAKPDIVLCSWMPQVCVHSYRCQLTHQNRGWISRRKSAASSLWMSTSSLVRRSLGCVVTCGRPG